MFYGLYGTKEDKRMENFELHLLKQAHKKINNSNAFIQVKLR